MSGWRIEYRSAALVGWLGAHDGVERWGLILAYNPARAAFYSEIEDAHADVAAMAEQFAVAGVEHAPFAVAPYDDRLRSAGLVSDPPRIAPAPGGWQLRVSDTVVHGGWVTGPDLARRGFPVAATAPHWGQRYATRADAAADAKRLRVFHAQNRRALGVLAEPEPYGAPARAVEPPPPDPIPEKTRSAAAPAASPSLFDWAQREGESA